METSETGMYNIEEDNNSLKNELLNTIKVPQNLAQLTKRLPKSNYAKKNETTMKTRTTDVMNSYNGPPLN